LRPLPRNGPSNLCSRMTLCIAASTKATAPTSICGLLPSRPADSSGPRRGVRQPKTGPRPFTTASRAGSGPVAADAPAAVHDSTQVQVVLSRAWLMKRHLARPRPQPGCTRNSTGGNRFSILREAADPAIPANANQSREAHRPAFAGNAGHSLSPEPRGPASANASRARALTIFRCPVIPDTSRDVANPGKGEPHGTVSPTIRGPLSPTRACAGGSEANESATSSASEHRCTLPERPEDALRRVGDNLPGASGTSEPQRFELGRRLTPAAVPVMRCCRDTFQPVCEP
jgi:hypothetical protein